MANKSYFFDHDYSARNDDKILEMRSVYKAEGYGVFWMIIETMAENEDGGINLNLIGGLSVGYGVPKGWLSEFISYCISINLFTEKDNKVFSNRLLKHKNRMGIYVESGKLGAEKRWGAHRVAIGSVSGGDATPNAKRVERVNKKEERGVNFSSDGLSVVFKDGTTQMLGHSQLLRMKEGNYEPHYVKKGLIE